VEENILGKKQYCSDIQQLEAFVCLSDHCGFVPLPAKLPMFTDLCENAVEKLFNQRLQPILHYLLPPQSQGPQRQRPHNFALPLELTQTIFNTHGTLTHY